MARPCIRSAVAPTCHLTVAERGLTDLSAATWRELSGEPSFWRLVDKGIVRVSRPAHGRMRLHGMNYVGRAVCGNIVLDIDEKIDGALEALFGFATREAFRVEQTPGPRSLLGRLAALLVHQFVRGIKRYATMERDRRYTVVSSRGSLVGGRLDIGKTVRLRARGLGHLLAFDRNHLSHDTPLNRVLFVALREIENLTAMILIDKADIASARSLTGLFADCRNVETLFGQRSSFLDLADEVARTSPTKEQRDLLALASIIIAHESFDRGQADAGPAPRAWFLNLEVLFQNAVRNVLDGLSAPGWSVTGADRPGPRIFANVARGFRAHPDLVVRAAAGPFAIGDVKYKTWDGETPESRHHDMYQLLVHGTACAVDRCFLVYPRDQFESREFGAASTGAQTWLFGVDVRRLDDDLRRALGVMAVPCSPP